VRGTTLFIGTLLRQEDGQKQYDRHRKGSRKKNSDVPTKQSAGWCEFVGIKIKAYEFKRCTRWGRVPLLDSDPASEADVYCRPYESETSDDDGPSCLSSRLVKGRVLKDDRNAEFAGPGHCPSSAAHTAKSIPPPSARTKGGPRATGRTRGPNRRLDTQRRQRLGAIRRGGANRFRVPRDDRADRPSLEPCPRARRWQRGSRL
jgi:hypothetical protein